MPADPSLEIVASAIAPLEQEILVWIETAAAPAAGMTFGILVDLVTNPGLDLRIDLDTVGSDHWLTVAEKYGGIISVDPIPGLEVDVGACGIEVRIPYAVLAPYLPRAMATAILSANQASGPTT